MERNKNPVHPRVPNTLLNLKQDFRKPEILKKYGYTHDGDQRFYVDTIVAENYGFTVFASEFAIDFMQKNIAPGSRIFLMDATFDSLPDGFYQLLVTTVEFQKHVSYYK